MGFRFGLFAFAAVMMAVGHAAAGLVPVNFGFNDDGGDKYRYSYGVQLQPGSTLKSGDYITIYDFQGLVPGSNTQPAGFTFSAPMTGPKTVANDNASIPNLTWTYTGSDLNGPVNLGSFSAVSNYNTTADDVFTGQTHNQSDGKIDATQADRTMPVPSMTNCHMPSVPEPSSIYLFAAAVPFVYGLRRFRRARATA
jgi:hypothetical protein